MNLYAIAVMASKGEKDGLLLTTITACESGYVSAHSVDEARGKAVRLFEKAFPKEEGWYGHQASVTEISQEVMRSFLEGST